MKKLVLNCVLILSLLANPLMVFAQTAPRTATGNWETVKLVSVGSELVVKLKDGKTIKARHAGATDAAVTVSRKNRLLEIQRSTIHRVSIVVKTDKDKAQAIGAGIGAVSIPLIAIGGTEGTDPAAYVVVMAFIGAAFGYLFGSLVGLPRKAVLIYEGDR